MNKLIQKALDNVAKMLSSKREIGKQFGETAAIIFRDYVIIKGAKITLSKISDIHLSRTGSVNNSGEGIHIGKITQGSDGNFYKEVDDKIYIWNGSDWV